MKINKVDPSPGYALSKTLFHYAIISKFIGIQKITLSNYYCAWFHAVTMHVSALLFLDLKYRNTEITLSNYHCAWFHAVTMHVLALLFKLNLKLRKTGKEWLEIDKIIITVTFYRRDPILSRFCFLFDFFFSSPSGLLFRPMRAKFLPFEVSPDHAMMNISTEQ